MPNKKEGVCDGLVKKFLIKRSIQTMGRVAPSALRFLAFHNHFKRGRWFLYSALVEDPICRAWLASLENPTKTRHDFKIYTLPEDINSDWIKVHGQHECSTERFILDHLKPDSTFLDIGANIGYFSLLAATTGKASRVVAFEPQREIADLLEESVAYNKVQDVVRVERLALSNVPARMTMTQFPHNAGGAHLSNLSTMDAGKEVVSVVVLDDWLEANPQLPTSICKIDIEGAELQALIGMAHLLDRDHPAIVIELINENLSRFAASRSDVCDLLRRHGYKDVSENYIFYGDSNAYFVANP